MTKALVKSVEKQRAFAEEYIKDFNGTRAAIAVGYSKKGARVRAVELLDRPDVQEIVAELIEERSKKTGIDAAWLLTRLAEEATADLADIIDENGVLKPIEEWPLIWRQGLVSGIEIEDLFEGRGADREKVGSVAKVKLSDRKTRLELIGRHVDVRAFRDQLEVSLDEDLATALKKARASAKA